MHVKLSHTITSVHCMGKNKGLRILGATNDVLIVREGVDYHITLAFTKLDIVWGDKCGMWRRVHKFFVSTM